MKLVHFVIILLFFSNCTRNESLSIPRTEQVNSVISDQIERKNEETTVMSIDIDSLKKKELLTLDEKKYLLNHFLQKNSNFALGEELKQLSILNGVWFALKLRPSYVEYLKNFSGFRVNDPKSGLPTSHPIEFEIDIDAKIFSSELYWGFADVRIQPKNLIRMIGKNQFIYFEFGGDNLDNLIISLRVKVINQNEIVVLPSIRGTIVGLIFGEPDKNGWIRLYRVASKDYGYLIWPDGNYDPRDRLNITGPAIQ